MCLAAFKWQTKQDCNCKILISPRIQSPFTRKCRFLDLSQTLYHSGSSVCNWGQMQSAKSAPVSVKRVRVGSAVSWQTGMWFFNSLCEAGGLTCLWRAGRAVRYCQIKQLPPPPPPSRIYLSPALRTGSKPQNQISWGLSTVGHKNVRAALRRSLKEKHTAK